MLTQFTQRFGGSIEAADRQELELDMSDDSAPFYLTAHFVELAAEYSPSTHGSLGFMFVRADDDDEYKLAVGDLWTLVFFEALLGSTSQTKGMVVGAPVSSQGDVALARKWIRDCMENHPHDCCSPSKPVRLPTRLLDVSPAGGSDEVRLVITNGNSGQFITLSHRWGGLKPITLTAQTLPGLLQGIAVTSLPKTFQDAVTITRDLGYRYLWIDSLCILQDSKADWENAVVEMPDIYNFAEVNICGPAAADCNAGFLHPRFIPPEWMDIKIPWRITEDGPVQPIRVIYKGPLPNNGELPHSEPVSALASRGWILQERLLSQRMLYFGSRSMYWECNTTTSFESLHFPVPRDSPLRIEIAKLSFGRQDKSRRDWLRTWYELIDTYSTMDLTYQTDKFPAISALAQRFSQVLNDQYVAGLWRSDIVKGLAWHITAGQQLSSLADQDAKPYVAPSWSWASTEREIRHLFTFTNEWPTYPDLIQAEVIDVTTVPASSTFSSLAPNRSSITLRARPFTARVTRGYEGFLDTMLWKAHTTGLDSFPVTSLGTFYPDHELEADASYDFLFIPIAYYYSEAGKKRAGEKEYITPTFPLIAVAIAVERCSVDPGKYRRRGLMFVDDGMMFSARHEVIALGRVLWQRSGEREVFQLI